jgi:hypothetical protein
MPFGPTIVAFVLDPDTDEHLAWPLRAAPPGVLKLSLVLQPFTSLRQRPARRLRERLRLAGNGH